jgi:quinol monooxygenase YgiN
MPQYFATLAQFTAATHNVRPWPRGIEWESAHAVGGLKALVTVCCNDSVNDLSSLRLKTIALLTHGQERKRMYVTLVNVHVKAQHIDEFIEATRVNHENSIKEPGNVRFDVLQSADDPAKFVLYEAYQSKDDAVAHKDTPHYLTWRETVADWMAEPRQGITYNGLYPAGK